MINLLFLPLFGLYILVIGAHATPKILICSDSTTADYNASSPLQGWGHFLGDYMTAPVVNKARNGRSTRSFIREGLWAQLLAMASPGDFIVIEMGHNDAGDPSMKNSNKDKASRATLPGTGSATVIGPLKDGTTETVHTFGWYLREMVKDVRKKNAIPLISGMVPTNSFRGASFRKDWPMATSAATIAKEENVEYIDHTKYSSERFQGLGEGAVKAFFPTDSTHTNAAGAKVNAETFVTALKCARSKAATYIGPRGQALRQNC